MSMDPRDQKREFEKREHFRAAARKRWADPEYRARQTERIAAAKKAWWADPKNRAAGIPKLVARNKSAGQRAAASASMTKKLADPAFKAMLAANMTALHKRPEIKARTIAHAKAQAAKIKADRLARRDVIPPGLKKLYRKLRNAGMPRADALRECWGTHDGVAT